MRKQIGRLLIGTTLVICAASVPYPAAAGDFFFNLFGAFAARPPAP